MLRRIAAEGIGSLLLAATVIGSGIMAERLAAGNLAVALIANTGATVAVLATLIALLGPVSGAHFNPAVSLVQALCGALPWREAAAYVPIQVLGCCAGAVLAHAMFSLPLIQTSLHERTGIGQWVAEFVATLGLLGLHFWMQPSCIVFRPWRTVRHFDRTSVQSLNISQKPARLFRSWEGCERILEQGTIQQYNEFRTDTDTETSHGFRFNGFTITSSWASAAGLGTQKSAY